MSTMVSHVLVTGPRDHDGKLNVVACGYNHNMKFGYWICKQEITDDGLHLYTNQAFFQKIDETTFQSV